MGTSCEGQTEAASFQNAATSRDCSGNESFMDGDYTGVLEPGERVQPLLLVDRRPRAVAADDRGVARENEQFFPDRGEDGIGVSAPEVRPADGATKERVSREENGPVALEQEACRAGRMPRGMNRAQCVRAEADPLGIGERCVRRQGRLGAQPEEGGLLGERVVQGAVCRMEADRCARGFLNRARGGDVVEVRVGVEQCHGRELRRFEDAQDALGLVARIDDDRLARDRVREDRAVALERPDGKRFDQGLGAQGFTGTTVSTSWRSVRAGQAQMRCVEEGENWIAHSWLSGRRRSDAKSLRRLRGVKISQRT